MLDTQIDHLEKNIPAMHRACLFWIWQMSENAGLQYTDKVANAHSIFVQKVEQELLPHMTDAERRANSYYNRRAPNCQIAVESLEAITFMTSIPS
jgi:hypothetical protein